MSDHRTNGTADGKTQQPDGSKEVPVLHPAWRTLILYCEQLQFGELEKIRIQNGLPMTVEIVRTKMRLAHE